MFAHVIEWSLDNKFFVLLAADIRRALRLFWIADGLLIALLAGLALFSLRG